MPLKLEKWSSPAKFPTGVFTTDGFCFVTSVDKAVASARSGDFVIHVSRDLEHWTMVLRHSTPCHPVVAYGGLVVHRGAKDTVWSADGTEWTALPFPGAFFTSDGAGGLWSIGERLTRRRVDDVAFERVETEITPGVVFACEAVTLLGKDGSWWRLLDGGRCEPVPTLKRRRVEFVSSAGPLIVAVVDEALWRSTDGGQSFVPCESKVPVLGVAWVDGALVAGGRGALISSRDARTFSTVSENPEAEFGALASTRSGALVVDGRRHRLFGLAEKGQRPLLTNVPAPPVAEHPALATAARRFAELEAPLLARRTSSLDLVRTQAERLAPSPGFQPHLVYLDALQDAGDPDAPHLAMLNRLQQGPRFLQYLREHLETLVGHDVLHAPAEWKNGFLHRVSLHTSALPALFARTASHLLRELSVWSRDGSTADVSSVWQQVRALEAFSLDGIEWHDEGATVVGWGDLSALWPAVGQLTSLFVSGEVSRFGPLVFPKLERLSLVLDGATQVDELRSMLAPNLDTLRVGLGHTAEPGWLVDLLSRDAWPRLRAVALSGRFVRPFLEALPRGPWLTTLDELALAGNALDDAAVERLRELLPRRLRVLDLRWNQLGTAGLERAASLADRVHSLDQHAPTDVHWPPGWFAG